MAEDEGGVSAPLLRRAHGRRKAEPGVGAVLVAAVAVVALLCLLLSNSFTANPPLLQSTPTLLKHSPALYIQMPCSGRDFGHGSPVCVCNASYCDTLQLTLSALPGGKYLSLTSSKAGQRFEVADGWMSDSVKERNPGKPGAVLRVKAEVKHQTIIGFGGAFTDAAGINLAALPKALQIKIMRAYYGADGLGYTMGRVPMGGTDFSTHPYTYDDVENDTDLTHFALTSQDYLYKIPYLEKARSLEPSLRLISCPWTAPAWMKTNGAVVGGRLRVEYAPSWTTYFLRFLAAYAEHGLHFWATSLLNEPSQGGLTTCSNFSGMFMSAAQERDWLKAHLGPALHSSPHRHLRVLIHEDNRDTVLNYSRTILSDAEAARYATGISMHWYEDQNVSVSELKALQAEFPSYFLIGTEASIGRSLPDCSEQFREAAVVLGSWERAETYARDMIQNLGQGYTGWLDWNLVLDEEGGPNWVHNFVDAPIIVNATGGEAYKQPMYYALGHFSKLIPPNSVRVETELEFPDKSTAPLQALAFLRQDGKTTLLLLNTGSAEVEVEIEAVNWENGTQVRIGPRSIVTLVY